MTQKQEHQEQRVNPGATSSEETAGGASTGTEQRTERTEEKAQEGGGIERGGVSTGIERTTGGGLGRPDIWSSPASFMHRMLDEMDRMFSRFGGGVIGGMMPSSLFELAAPEGIWSPQIETFERDDKLVLRADLPGLEHGDVKVEVVGDELVISGQRKKEERRTTGGGYYSERRYGCFERRIRLPEGVEPENIDASFENGVLEVELAKPEQKPNKRTIEVKTGQQQGKAQHETQHETEAGAPRSVH